MQDEKIPVHSAHREILNRLLGHSMRQGEKRFGAKMKALEKGPQAVERCPPV